MERMFTILGCLVILAVAPPATAEEPEQDRTPPGIGMGACVLPGGHTVPADGEIPWRGLESVGPPVTKVIGKSGVPAGVVRPVRWTENSDQGDILTPKNRMRTLNGLSLYFSSATGGFGFRLGYDRRLTPVLRLIAANEYMTYGPVQASRKLGEHLRPRGAASDPDIDAGGSYASILVEETNCAPRRIRGRALSSIRPSRRRLRGLPFGWIRPRYGVGGRVRRHKREDDRNGGDLLADSRIFHSPWAVMSSPALMFGFGKNKDLAVTTDGRYTVARFSDALGNPGDLSGFSLSIGAGRYF